MKKSPASKQKQERTRKAKQKLAAALRAKRIKQARRRFWIYCQVMAPDFYMPDRHHLRELCDFLQAVYEKKILKPDGTPYRKVKIKMPPRHGKTRTLVLFCAWILGVCLSEQIIATSYNDTLALEFSEHTRNTISREKNRPQDITHQDIFPECRIQRGQAAKEKWALIGQYGSYKSSGVRGTLTGRGGSVILVDDLVKDAFDAYNVTALNRNWLWFTGTLLSRGEQDADSEEELIIVMGTPWAKADHFGRIEESEDADEWVEFKREAIKGGKVLCPTILTLKKYLTLKRNMDRPIFRANYHLKPIDIEGRLYPRFLTYSKLPTDESGNLLMTRIVGRVDTADQGDDYLAAFVALQYGHEAWILDTLYTKDGMEVTEPATAKLFTRNKVTDAIIESNNGGRGFARNVKRELKALGNTWTKVRWKHESRNKEARILSMSNYVIQNIYMPHNWHERWPELYDALTDYLKEGGNDHDDAPDALTGLAEMIAPDSAITIGPSLY